MSYIKTTWTNDSGEKINATNLNHVEQGIYDNDISIGDMSNLKTTATNLVDGINEIYDKVDDRLQYLLNTEIDTGKTWLNGEKIYRQIIRSYGTTGTDLQITHNISNIDTPTSYKMISINNGTTYFQDYTSTGQFATLLNPKRIDNTYLYCDIGGGFDNWNIYHIVEYTKTS